MKKPPEEQDPSKKIVKKVEERPCGCRVTIFSDDNKLYSPCVPCGMFAVADNLNNAAQAMAAIATRLQGEQQQAQANKALADAARKVVKP